MNYHGFFVGGHNLEFFAVPPAKRLLFFCVFACVLERDWEFSVMLCAISALFGVLQRCAVGGR